jgi:DNA-binding transcriptional regulator YhcF (GntR family)
MCIAHEALPYGYLSINGKPMTDAQLSRMVGVSPAVLNKSLKELEDAGVFSRDDSGVIFSRRMVKDEHIRSVRASAGKAGGNPNLVRQDIAIDCLEGLGLLNQSSKQTPTPSSSSSSSSSNPDGLVVGSPSLPPCPHLRLLELFGHHLPDLPQPKPELWQGKNADAMRARWRWVLTAKTRAGKRYAVTEAEAVDWFSRFFAYVSRSDFLTGRSGKWTNCDLGWLMKADNFAKVVQGNYENRGEE